MDFLKKLFVVVFVWEFVWFVIVCIVFVVLLKCDDEDEEIVWVWFEVLK